MEGKKSACGKKAEIQYQMAYKKTISNVFFLFWFSIFCFFVKKKQKTI